MHIELLGLGDNEDNDEEMENPHKLRKFHSPLQAWDIFCSNILWTIWVERCKLVIGGSQFSSHSILFCFWRDISSVATALWVEIQRFAHKRTIETHANLVDEFKVAWVGGLNCLEDEVKKRWQFNPPDCMFPSSQY